MKKLRNFINSNRNEVLSLVAILLLGAFLRFYKIDSYMTFLGDEGRDVLLVRRFLVNGDIFLIGPGTSIGNMYLGPLYYYMMAPFLWLGGYSPVAPAVMIATLGVVTIAFVWFVGREWFGKNAGLISAFLYAISPTVIIYSRSSWNPNIMPFFSLLCVYSIWRVNKKLDYKWLIVLGVSFAFVLQSHYLGLLLAPTLVLFWLLTLIKNRKIKNWKFVRNSIIAFIIFAGLMSPLVIFDSRHGWQNFGAIKKFFLERQTTVSARPWNALPSVWPLLQEITTRLVAGRNALVGSFAALFMVGGTVLVFRDRKRFLGRGSSALLILVVWLGVALIGLGLYKQQIYDHYYGFFFAAPFLLIGAICAYFMNKSKIRGVWIAAVFMVFITYYNYLENPLRAMPNNQLARTREISEKVRRESKGEKFNLAVLAERNYEDAYQYFLERWGTGVIDIDPLNTKDTISEQLFVICELPPEKCSPVNNPKTQIANFGWSKIENSWDVAGATIYKLVHNKQ